LHNNLHNILAYCLIKAFEILQKKAEQGYKDVDGFIKARIIQQLHISVSLKGFKNVKEFN